jgi:Tfp pilus assembly protein PilN
MSIISYIKIGLAVLVLAALGYLIWNYQHMKTVIAEQKDQIATLQLGQQILAEEQKQFKQFMAKRTTATKKVTNEQDAIRQSETTGNDADLDLRLERYWVQPNQSGTPAPRRAGSPRNTAPGTP